MAFADTAQRVVLEGWGKRKVTLATVAQAGDPIGYSSGWKQADANASIPAEYVAGEDGEVGDEITLYLLAVVRGFTGGTAGAKLYLSDTAGKYSDATGTKLQRVGQMLSATEALISFLPTEVQTVRSKQVDLDFGAATDDEVLLVPSRAITIVGMRLVYEGATSGTVAGGNITVGTAVDGEQIVAPQAFENTKAVGYTKALTLVTTKVAAGAAIHVRWTGVAATQAGAAHIEMDYIVDPEF